MKHMSIGFFSSQHHWRSICMQNKTCLVPSPARKRNCSSQIVSSHFLCILFSIIPSNIFKAWFIRLISLKSQRYEAWSFFFWKWNFYVFLVQLFEIFNRYFIRSRYFFCFLLLEWFLDFIVDRFRKIFTFSLKYVVRSSLVWW